ncbi:MAG TPA: hypothetical protein VEN29_04625 [Casimicrobiaceae bacterium]|nr:hypothetical protein [Casimicrobiaceae bacterium]
METKAAANKARTERSGPKAGAAVVAIWNDIRSEARADFYEWHNREHMAERVGIPGFRRGRRFVAIEAEPEFFTLYDTDGPHVLDGAEYLQRLNHPTPGTRRLIAAFLNMSRSLCNVALSLGGGEGGLMMTLRYEVADGRAAQMTDALAKRALPMLVARPGVARARLCIADRRASGIQTVEKKNTERARVPSWIILVEGAAEAAALESACDELLSLDVLTAAGATAPVERGLYQLQYALTPDRGGAAY